MADVGTRGNAGGGCNDSCGCPSPCPGGQACRCETTIGGGEHMRCSCGEHCGCNPCNCSQSNQVTGVGKAHCKCGAGCGCVKCAS